MQPLSAQGSQGQKTLSVKIGRMPTDKREPYHSLLNSFKDIDVFPHVEEFVSPNS